MATKAYFQRVNSPGWSTGDDLTHGQINSLDIDHALAAGELELFATSVGRSVGVSAAALTASTAFATGAAAFSPTNGMWYVWNNGASTTAVSHSGDGGRTWYVDSVAGLSINVLGCAFGNANGRMMAVAASTTFGLIQFNPGTGTFSSTTSVGTAPTAGEVFWYPVAGEFVAIAAAQSGGTFTGFAWTSTDGASIVDVHTSLPATWQSATNHVGTYYSAVGTLSADAIVALAGVTAGADTARLLHVTFPSSVLTMTDITPAIFTGKIVLGVAWDSIANIWGACLYDGTNTVVYETADLVTWVLARSIVGLASGFAIVRGVWLMGAPLVVEAAGPVTIQRLSASFDVSTQLGSSTWHWLTSPTDTIDALFGNDSQLLTYTGGGARCYLSALGGFV